MVRLLVVVCALLFAVFSGVTPTIPPSEAPATEPGHSFSAARAMRHVEIIARGPRPVSSPGHAAAQAYIVAELRKIGLSPEIQRTVSAFRFPGSEGFSASAVENIIARIPGSLPDGAILLDTHYDGATTGPAAGDCAACVATALETARAIVAGPQIRNDVIFVFSDAEEVGDHGAHAFATQHPWMRDVRLALNYEAMGSRGIGALYVTSPGNLALVGALAQAMPRGFGSSFVTAIFNATPDLRNACNLQDYLNAGVAGLGFVLHGDTQNYHTLLDDPAHLDPRSVQSFGQSALGVIRAFGNAPLDSLKVREDATFFALWPVGVIRYPATWSLALALAALSGALGLSALGARKRSLSGVGVGMGALGTLFLVVAVTAATGAVWWGVRALNPNLQVFLIGGYATPWNVAGLNALAVAGVLAAMGLWKARPMTVLASVFVLAAVVGLALAIIQPTMAYPAIWPALFGLPSLACLVFAVPGGRLQRIGGWLSLVPLVVIVAILTSLVGPSGMLTAFSVRLEALSGLPLMVAPMILTTFAAAFTAVAIPYVLDIRRGPVGAQIIPAVLTLAGLCALVGGAAFSGFNEEQPRPEAVRYELDADTGLARWVTNDAMPGAWSGLFISPRTPRRADGAIIPGRPPTYSATAPVVLLTRPTVRVLSDERSGTERRIRLELRSPRGAPIMEVKIEAGTLLRAASIAGQTLDLTGYTPAAKGRLWFYAFALVEYGVTVDLEIAGTGPVRIALADITNGLPDIAGQPTPVRPTTTMPMVGMTLDGTIVRTTFTIASSRLEANAR